MPAFMLDTSALIDLELLELGAFADGLPILSAVTLGELAFGLGLGLGDAGQQDARDEVFRDARRNYEIIPFGVEEAKIYGVLATLVRATGRNPRPRRLDLQIAATAAAARLPLLTCNPDDFVGTDRMVEIVAVPRAR